LLCAAGCEPEEGSVLKVFHAGSLAVPFQRLEGAFEAENPGLDVQREAYGSATAIRQVTELGRRADVVASADAELIDRLMIETGQAEWNVMFAGNAMCIAYGDHARPLTGANWADALSDERARVGISDPNADPCGYRSLFCLYLAGAALGEGRLFERLVGTNSDITVKRTGAHATIRVPGGIGRRGRLLLRPKEVDLVALLEAGAIDYLLIYRSVAVQHGLRHVELPDEVNLSSHSLREAYRRVRVVQFADMPGRAVEIEAGPIVYGVTIPSSAPRSEAAVRFVRLLLSDRGRRILEECGQPALQPPALSPGSLAHTVPFSL
jgi:molybdate/tungstate transport system substrate-binding protein